MDTFIGLELGNYRIQRYLDEGGMADLYLGLHIGLGTSVAIKILKEKLAQNDKHRDEFKEEAVRIAHLEHPHIVRILDYGFVNERPYLIMPLATGSLKNTQGTILSLDTIVTYIKQIAEALEYAHDHNIVHRDIKPGNFLIGSRGELLLSDFGIATITHSVRTSQQDVIGTPQYMPPEQWQGKARRASDQYALGIVVYQWLCGAVPFRGSMEQLMWAHLQQDPPSFKERGVQVPPEVGRVVRRALAKAPEDRYGGVQNFANALEGCLPKPGTLLHTYYDHYRNVCSLAWSPDGKHIASVSRDRTAHMWEVTTQRQVFTWHGNKGDSEKRFQPLAPVVAWAPHKMYIAVGNGDHEVSVYDANTGSEVPEKTFTGHGENNVAALAWSPDGTYIALISHNDMLQVWDADTGDLISTCDCRSKTTKTFAYALAWSPDGTRIASVTGADMVWISDIKTGHHISYYGSFHCPWAQAVAWSPDGTRIASSAYNVGVDVWEANTRTHIYTYCGHRTKRRGGEWPPTGARTLAWSPDGK